MISGVRSVIGPRDERGETRDEKQTTGGFVRPSGLEHQYRVDNWRYLRSSLVSRLSSMSATRPHLILIGGFLGAGKTAALLALGRWLADQGIRAAFITNDQGTDLVDTRVL